MSSHPTVRYEKEISTIHIRPGETITLMLWSKTLTTFPHRQVEVRVTPDGKAEVFCRSEDIQCGIFKTFDDWAEMKEEDQT